MARASIGAATRVSVFIGELRRGMSSGPGAARRLAGRTSWRGRDRAVVEAVRPVGGLEPHRPAPEVVGAADHLVEAVRGQRRVGAARGRGPGRLGGTRGDAGGVGVGCRGGVVGAARLGIERLAGGQPRQAGDGRRSGGAPAGAVVAAVAGVLVDHHRRVVGAVVVGGVVDVIGRAVTVVVGLVAAPRRGAPGPLPPRRVAAVGAVSAPRAFATGGRAAVATLGAPGPLAAGAFAAVDAVGAPRAVPARGRSAVGTLGVPRAPAARRAATPG